MSSLVKDTCLHIGLCRGREDAQDKSMITGGVVSANVETVGSMSLRPLSCYDRPLSIVGGMKRYL